MLIKTLIERGSSHKLRCEDDLLVLNLEDYIVGAIFDGCSSGIDSHLSSTLLKRVLKTIINGDGNCRFELKWHNKESLDFYIIQKLASMLYDKLHEPSFKKLISYDNYNDLLSTVIIMLVNKFNNRYTVLFCGDGVLSVDDTIVTIHDENGDTVDYLMVQNETNVINYIDNRPFYQGYFKNTISISSDGIDTFKDQFGENKSKEAKDTLFMDTAFWKQDIMLNRKYNILTKVNKYLNQDDVSIIRIINENTINNER